MLLKVNDKQKLPSYVPMVETFKMTNTVSEIEFALEKEKTF